MQKEGGAYHELLLNLAEALDTGSQLEVVVRRSLGDGGDDRDPVVLGANVVRRGDARNVNIYVR